MTKRYEIDPARSRVQVRARSSIHDTNAVWNRVTGTVHVDPATLIETGATAALTVDMDAFDAGDWLRNRKLRKDMDTAAHPRATFELTALEGVTRTDDGRFSATARGALRWRGKTVEVSAIGVGSVADDGIEAEAAFELDVRHVGMKAPRFLMLKVEEIVAVTVTLAATPV